MIPLSYGASWAAGFHRTVHLSWVLKGLAFLIFAGFLPQPLRAEQANHEPDRVVIETCNVESSTGPVSEMLTMANAAVLSITTKRMPAPGPVKLQTASDKPMAAVSAPSGVVSEGYGAAVVLTAQGLLLTNYHVVADAKTILVDDGKSHWNGQLVAYDPVLDLALLQVEEGDGFTPIRFSQTIPAIGDTVFAIGNPFGYGRSVTKGMISALNRTYDGRDPKLYLQHDADLNWGNSGGALVDDQGCLIGINTAIHTTTGMASGFSLAIPLSTLVRVISDFTTIGYVDRSSIGVTVQALRDGLEQAFGRSDGLVLTSVADHSPAANAGLQTGDILLEIDGVMLDEPRDLSHLLSQTKSYTSLRLTWLRAGKMMEQALQTRPAPDAKAVHPAPVIATRGQGLIPVATAPLGLRVESQGQKLVITHVQQGSLAAQAGLRAKDIILGRSGQSGLSPEPFIERAEASLRACKTIAILIHRDSNQAQYVVVQPCPSPSARLQDRRGLGSAAGPY